MSRVLIIDRCWDCPSCHAVGDWPGKCERMDKSIGKPKERIPDWCQLRPMPEKIQNPVRFYEDGWNACIDAITGGRDEKTRNDKEHEDLRG